MLDNFILSKYKKQKTNTVLAMQLENIAAFFIDMTFINLK